MKKILCTLFLCFSFFWILEVPSYAQNKVIVIDAGHGGDNLGAEVDNIIEKEITLKVAKAMYDRLTLYEGVDVYMTRNGDETLSLKQRAVIAKDYNADYMIALHFNASEDHSLYGTECWVPYDNYFEEIYTLASYYIDEFTNIGLYNRGIKTRLNNDGDNYYGIIRESEHRNIPCLLVEHCHLDNENDDGYYETNEKLTQLGVLDADALAKYLGLSSKILGVDYSDYSLEVSVPLSENTRDKTGPNDCRITLKEYDESSGKATIILTAREEESSLLYYSYSIDGGTTFSEKFPLTKENTEISFVMEDGIVPDVVVRAYSLNDAYTLSNNLLLPQVSYPKPVKDSVTTIHLNTENSEKEQKREQLLSFFIFVMVLLLIVLAIVITLSIFNSFKRKRKKKKKNLSRKK